MQGELTAEAAGAPGRKPIDILGINAAGLESGNPSITAGRTLPWLQDVPNQDVWGKWRATWRDVIVLDAGNRAITVYNLTEHDLALPSNYEALKQILRDAASK